MHPDVDSSVPALIDSEDKMALPEYRKPRPEDAEAIRRWTVRVVSRYRDLREQRRQRSVMLYGGAYAVALLAWIIQSAGWLS